MQVIKSFDPSTEVSGSIEVGAADPGCKILLYNLSIYAIEIDFENGSTALLHAGEANWWELDGSTPFLLWSQYSKLNISAPSISQITGMLYRQDETIEGTYPVFVTYQLGIGNVVTTSQGATLSIQNDGAASGATIVEATQSGSPQSNVFLDNAANFFLQQYVGGVLLKILESVNGATPFVYFQGRKVSIDQNGNLTLGNQSTIVGKAADGTSGNWGGVDGSGNSFIQYNPKNKQLVIYNHNGVAVATFDVNSLLNLAGVSQPNNGDTSGTQSIIEAIYGAYKIVVVFQNNYKQAGGGFQNTLKNSFAQGAIWLNMGCGGLEATNGGAALSSNQITWGTGTAAGTSAAGTGMPSFSCGVVINAISKIGDSGGYASAHTGFGIFIGV